MKGLKVNMNFTKSSQNGITLIALIVTIIVLIIIAGISIATLTADNGVLRQTNLAKVQQMEANAREQVSLACAAMRVAIAEAHAQDNSYTAKGNASLIQTKLKELIVADTVGLDKDSWDTSDLNTDAGTFNITYDGDDYKQVCNDTNASITFEITLGQKSIEITDESNSTLKDQNGNNVEIDIGADSEVNPGDEGGSGSSSGSDEPDTSNDILPEQTLSFSTDSIYDGTYSAQVTVESGLLVSGNTYKVVWDGQEYTCLARDIKYTVDSEYVPNGLSMPNGLGNSKLLTKFAGTNMSVTEENTGEPFLINQIDSGIIFLRTKNTSATHTVRIYQ